jgi:MFS family permease
MSTRELAPEATSSLGAFRYLWSASLISTLGDGALLSALPLLAASLTRDPRLISAVTVTGRLPWLALALFCGVIVDRLDRHRLMLWTQAGQMLLVTVITLVAALGLSRMWMLYLFAFAIGIGDVLFQGSSQAFVPVIVRRDDLDAANGRLVAVEAVSHDFLGPPVGSVLWLRCAAGRDGGGRRGRRDIQREGRRPPGRPKRRHRRRGDQPRRMARRRRLRPQRDCRRRHVHRVLVRAVHVERGLNVDAAAAGPERTPRPVVSASRMLAYGATPLGALVGGFVASEYGLIAPWLVGGVLSLLVAVVSLPRLWRWDS